MYLLYLLNVFIIPLCIYCTFLTTKDSFNSITQFVNTLHSIYKARESSVYIGPKQIPN